MPQLSWEKFTGQPWSEHKDFGWTKKIHPEDTKHVLKAWEKACNELSLYETWGRIWNVNLKKWRSFAVRAVPIMNSDGSLREWVGIIIDITERKKAEEDLKKSEKRFQDIVACFGDWIWEIDKKGKYTFVSDKVTSILGYNPDEIIGKTPFDFMPKKEAVRIGKIFEKISSEKKPIVDLVNWNLTKDGSEVGLLTNGIPVLDDEGNYLGYRGVDKNITKFMSKEKVEL